MHFYHYGTDLDLERFVSQAVLLLTIPYFYTHNKQYICFILAPILAMCYVQGIHNMYYRKIITGQVQYEFVTYDDKGEGRNTLGQTVSGNSLEEGTYIITNTKFPPYKMTDEQVAKLIEVQRLGGLE